ncbi:DUF899 domain-containing protein [Dyella agri]|uniref:DUF899 domain-containing protein n=1 Tax=Dyella agri TaxID=1926869 RepID=A0ABW8KKT3_9GAMM
MLPLPPIASRDAWLAARKQLLAAEKEATRMLDRLNAQRRALPMVPVEKPYLFDTPDGEATLLGLFEGRHQLIVYHFMFHRDRGEGCPGCSFLTDNIGHLAHLHERGTTLALVSRAPLEELERFKARMGWTLPWYSSWGSDFNYDFHVSQDESVAPVEYNYRDKVEMLARGETGNLAGELPGVSVFLRDGERVFHSYSSYARGLDMLLTTHHYLDLTPFGRGEGWDGMPDLDGKGMNWLRLHDRYDDGQMPAPAVHSCCGDTP